LLFFRKHLYKTGCVKIVPQSEATKLENKILSKVSHPSIVSLIGVEILKEFIIIIFMELCETMTLFDMINSHSRSSEEDAKHVFQQIMSGL
jgi:serine/threonine protein kinase